MKYEIKVTSLFKKELKKAIKRGFNNDKLTEVVEIIVKVKNYLKNIEIIS